jgi:PPOX class probable F420-dependent enzyme
MSKVATASDQPGDGISGSRARLLVRKCCRRRRSASTSATTRRPRHPNRGREGQDGGVIDEKARLRVTAARVGRFASVDRDGRPHVVPICFALTGDRVVSVVDDKPKRDMHLRRLENVRENPDVQLVVDHYDDDWSALWWVRLSGRCRVIDDGITREQAIDLLADKYWQYREHRPTGPALVIDVTRIASWEAALGSDPADKVSLMSVDLLDELRAALDEIEPLIVGRIIDIEMARLRVLADPEALRLKFASLIESAVADAEPKRPLTARVTRSGSVARIEVLDERDGARSRRSVGSFSVPLAPGAASPTEA